MGRLHNLDMLRGLAAVAVLCAHAAILGSSQIAPVVSDVPSLLSHLGSTSVWLFFVISGFVISRPFIGSLLEGGSLPGMRSYARKRASRIYPLYWLSAAAALAFVGWRGAGTLAKPAHLLLLHNLVPGRSHKFIAVSWTLTIEMVFYIAVPIGAWLVHRAARRRPVSADSLAGIVLVGWATVIVYLAAVPFAIETQSTRLWLREVFPAVAGMFAPGILLAIAFSAPPTSRIVRVFRRLRDRPTAVLVAAIAFCALGASMASIDLGPPTMAMNLAAWDLSRHAYAVGYGLLVTWAAVIPRWSFRGVGVLEYLGDVSYGVYLIHGTLLMIYLGNPGVVPMFGEGGLVVYAVHLAFLAGTTLPLAAISWRWLEEPLVRWARRPSTDRAVAVRV